MVVAVRERNAENCGPARDMEPDQLDAQKRNDEVTREGRDASLHVTR